jgi:hypothetical protein
MAITFVPDARCPDVRFYWVYCTGDDQGAAGDRCVAPLTRCVSRHVSLVPVSKTPPSRPEPHHHEFRPRGYDFFDHGQSVWAKADMVTCVGSHRLDRVMLNGRYTRCQIRKGDLYLVRVAVLHALGTESWKQAEVEVKRTLIDNGN